MLQSTTCNDPDPEPNPVPTVTTNPVINVTATFATGGGHVTSDGGTTVTEKGVCWNTSSDPTISDSHTNDGSGTGTFASEITGLTENTTYSVRAYAKNSAGVGYGETETFTTPGDGDLPVVTTSAVSDITNESAVCGGTITSDGGASWVIGGVCWSTSPDPNKTDFSSIDINNEGSYTSSLTGLTADTKYYIRAYATNNNGTSYGNEVSFTTFGSGDAVCDYETSVSYGGQTYEIDAIGDQCWMIDNLNIEEVSGNIWCYDDNPANCAIYGRLYDWETLMDGAVSSNTVPSGVQGICPAGWHIPSEAGWRILQSELQWSGGYGFPGLSSGLRNPDGSYSSLGSMSFYWSSTEYELDNSQVWYSFTQQGAFAGLETISKDHGFSVRCLKD
jgi:hypothetical protein